MFNNIKILDNSTILYPADPDNRTRDFLIKKIEETEQIDEKGK